MRLTPSQIDTIVHTIAAQTGTGARSHAGGDAMMADSRTAARLIDHCRDALDIHPDQADFAAAFAAIVVRRDRAA